MWNGMASLSHEDTTPQSLADALCSRRTQDLDAKSILHLVWQNSVRGNNPQNAYVVYQPRRLPNIVQSVVELR